MVARQPTVRPPRLLAWTASLLLHGTFFASLVYLLPLTIREESASLPAEPMDIVMQLPVEEESMDEAQDIKFLEVPIEVSEPVALPLEIVEAPLETRVAQVEKVVVAPEPREKLAGGSEPTSTTGSLHATLSVFGNEARGSKFVFVFDRSISMEGAPLRAAKSQLLAGLNALDECHAFQIVFFNHEPESWKVEQGEPQLISATAVQRTLAEKFVDSIVARGGTYRRSALLLALQMQPDVIYFLTDADAPMGGNDVLEAVRIARSNKTAIHSIEFGMFPQPSQENFLKQLSRYTGGHYVYISMDEL